MDHYLFLLKNILGHLLMPIPVTILLLLWATMLLLRRKTRWLGIIVVALSTALLFAASYPPLSNQYIAHYENQTPQYSQKKGAVDYIAVLGSGHQSTANQPVTSELKPTAIVRLAEGIRIYRLNPGSKLILTGFRGVTPDPVSFPDKLSELAIALGVPTDDILVFNGPHDTAEEAKLLAHNFTDTEIVLVTTAVHMPRALFLFQQAGLNPIPAPTEHLSKPHRSWWLFPSGETLAKGEYWAHEQLGLIWAKLVQEVADKRSEQQAEK